jgi:hypothetical protein
MRKNRRRHVPPDLTSLFDVLFIVIFAALIRAAAAQHAAAEAAAPKPPPAPLDPASLQARAVAQVGARPAIVVRVSATGTITALEANGTTKPLDVPLLEHSADPDVALAYLGDRSTDLQLCKVAALHLGEPLAKYLVIIAPARASADLPHALYEGLERDIERCQGMAVLVDPGFRP